MAADLAAQINAGDALKQKGNEAYKAKMFEEALSLYDQAIAAHPNEMVYHNNKAAVYMEMGEYEKAIEQLQGVLDRRYEINSANKEGATFEKAAKVMVRIATCLAKLKKFAEAKDMFQKALTEDNNKHTRNALREVELERDIYEKTAYLDPAKSEEHRVQGNDFFKAQKWVEAKKEYDEAIKRNPEDARLYSNRAATLTKLLAYPDALRDLDVCLKLDPKFIKAYSRKGTIHFFTKEYNKALEDYECGLKIDPTNQECLNGREAVLNKVRENQASSGGPDEEQMSRAMQDPEIQKILADPKINLVLREMQENPNVPLVDRSFGGHTSSQPTDVSSSP
eukprot:GEMP01039321.1.p1 GENE.GEMP01039321.1~~GEMP01039321.1.p1  ORF type:complete len:337 (+),score=80.57 GEMP01039321.1:43-1053(+)